MPSNPTTPPSDVLALIDSVARSVARSRRLSPNDADDFAQSVHLRMANEDYEILQRFEGRSTLRTYLTVVTARMLKDWQNHHYGKWRPCAAAERLGPVGVTLDRLINRDGAEPVEAVRTVSARAGLAEVDVWRVADQVPRRAKRHLVSIDVAASRGTDFEDPVAASEQAREVEATRSALNRALSELPRDDARLMVLRFVGQHTVSALARRTGADAKRLYRRFERIRKDLRERLQAKGFARAAS